MTVNATKSGHEDLAPIRESVRALCADLPAELVDSYRKSRRKVLREFEGVIAEATLLPSSNLTSPTRR